jgi:hypothetical protein
VNSWKIIFPTIVIFGVGVVTGALLIKQFDNKLEGKSKPVAASPVLTNSLSNMQVRREPPAGMDQRRIDFMRNVSSNLNLSAEQRIHVDDILHDGQERIRKLWDDFNPKTREELNDVRSKIVAQLAPEQKLKFDELLKRPARKPDESSTNRPPREIKRNATNAPSQPNAAP